MKKMSLLLASLFSLSSYALNLQGYRFTDSYRFATLDDSLQEKFDGNYVLTASAAYIKSPFYYTDEDATNRLSDIINYMYVGTIGYSYYLTDRLSLGGDLGIVHNKVYGNSKTSLGDFTLKGKWSFYQSESFSFSINPQLYLPTGKSNNFSTVDSIGGSLSFVGEYVVKKWHFLASLGYFNAKKNRFDIVDYRSLILSQLGISYDLSKKWNINLESIRNFTTAGDSYQDEGDYYLVMKNKMTNTLSTYFGGGLAGLADIDRNNYTIFAGLKFSEKTSRPKPVKIEKRSDESKLGVLAKAENIYFSNGSFSLMESEIKKLEDFILIYKQTGRTIEHVVIEGYASRVGNTEKNKVLGEKRAQAVKDYLVAHAIPDSKLSFVSYGDQAEQDKEEWKNRKVQFRVYKK